MGPTIILTYMKTDTLEMQYKTPYLYMTRKRNALLHVIPIKRLLSLLLGYKAKFTGVMV